MSTTKSGRTCRISTIETATEVLATSKKLVRELKAVTRQMRRSRRLSKNLVGGFAKGKRSA